MVSVLYAVAQYDMNIQVVILIGRDIYTYICAYLLVWDFPSSILKTIWTHRYLFFISQVNATSTLVIIREFLSRSVQSSPTFYVPR